MRTRCIQALYAYGSYVQGSQRLLIHTISRINLHAGCRSHGQPKNIRRGYVTNQSTKQDLDGRAIRGPLAEYDDRVRSGRLRYDIHQRDLITALQDLHIMLASYRPPDVIQSAMSDLQPPTRSIFSRIFGNSATENKLSLSIPPGLPKGLYMYGDVGSGKTMLMDLFYDTLPTNIHSKSRIHFHSFMQDVHRSLHQMKSQHGSSVDAIPFVAASIASRSSVLCFDEFQCTDVADAMILRRLIEALMHHGVVLITTSNRAPQDLYKNGIQRESFLPCIALLERQLRVLNLDSKTDYRKIPRPPSGVYHQPLDQAALTHADHWFKFLGDFEASPPCPRELSVWGRPITVPLASGSCARFTFQELIGTPTGAADYLELTKTFSAFIVTDVPGMDLKSRDLARRFITFIDTVYEAKAKLVLTCEKPLGQLFVSRYDVDGIKTQDKGVTEKIGQKVKNAVKTTLGKVDDATVQDDGIDHAMRLLMDDLGLDMDTLKESSIFSGDEEAFAFARALSRLHEMGSQEWIERGLDLNKRDLIHDAEKWQDMQKNWSKKKLEDTQLHSS